MLPEQKKRFDKIYTDKFYLLDASKKGEDIEFTITGSTANIYKMYLDTANLTIRCDCPDSTTWGTRTSTICKHCCFLLVRVVKIDVGILEADIFKGTSRKFTPQVFWQIKQKALKMVDSGRYGGDVFNADYARKFKQLKDGVKAQDYSVHKPIGDDDECCICYDELDGTDVANIIECPTCHNLLHKLCMEKWLSSGNKTCVYCRSDSWAGYFTGGNGGTGGTGKYKNLLV